MALVLLTLVLLFVLELLNAFYRSLNEAQAEDIQRDADAAKAAEEASGSEEAADGEAKPPPGCRESLGLIFGGLYMMLRASLSLVTVLGTAVSLYFHEVMHALVQLLMGARPRIVICQNGGYAEPLPWVGGPLGQVPLAFGYLLLGGVAGMAPVLGGSLVFYLLLDWLSPLDYAALRAQAQVLVDASPGGLPAALAGSAQLFLASAWEAGFLRSLPVLVAGALLANNLTPSSTDFVHSAYHLAAYAVAFVAGGALFGATAWAAWLLLGLGIGLVVACLLLMQDERRWNLSLGTLGMTWMAFAVLHWAGALGSAPQQALSVGLALVIQLLLLGALMCAVFLVLFLGVNLLGLQLDALALTVKKVPKHLRDVFTVFSTCKDCRLHFHDVCDGCGRSAEEIEAAAEASA